MVKMNKQSGSKKRRSFSETLFLIAMILLFAAVIGGLIGIEVYVWTTYGGAPVGEIPVWALFFMFGGK